jgi:CheY-like chemotaxis protein/HPt (histidine-containing phosphotransfer) domain-containing protein
VTDQEAQTPPAPPPDRRPIVLLLVDDQPFVGAVVKRLLATEDDIELHCCVTATDAVARANEVAPTLILQDLVMPDIDGLTLLGLFRENPATARTPVIVLSGNDDADTRARALAAGAIDYLVKLPAKEGLIAAIRRHATGEAAAGATSSGGPATGGTDTLDPVVMATFREADPDGASNFVAMVIDLFIRDAGSQVAAIRQAVPRRDAGMTQAAAHSLKGSSMTMGATRLGALCARLEDDAKASSAASLAPALLAAIDEEFARVREALATEQQRHKGSPASSPTARIIG